MRSRCLRHEECQMRGLCSSGGAVTYEWTLELLNIFTSEVTRDSDCRHVDEEHRNGHYDRIVSS